MNLSFEDPVWNRRSTPGPRRTIATRITAVAMWLAAIAPMTLAGNFSASAATAQKFSTTVRFDNLTPFPRTDWQLATVPFPQGVYAPTKEFTAVDASGRALRCDLKPFGASWPDGSHRFAQLAVRLTQAPHSTTIVTVREGKPSAGTFRLSNWVESKLRRNFDLRIAAGLPGRGIHLSKLEPVGLIHFSPARGVMQYRGRIPQCDLVYDLWLTFFSDQDYVPFELRVTNANTGSNSFASKFDFLALYTDQAYINIRGAEDRGTQYVRKSFDSYNILGLLGKTTLYDGQGQEWHGELHFVDTKDRNVDRIATMISTRFQPGYGVSQDWRKSGAFGPFGHIPADPSWLTDGGKAYNLARRARFVSRAFSPGGAWDDLPFGLRPHAGTTGDQYDFGAAKLLHIFASGMPHGIEEARYGASEDVRRPSHHREASGAPLESHNHRNWVAWGGRSHFNRAVCPDRLGKPFPEPYFDGHGWTTKDHEHWSSLSLASAYLLTGSWSLRAELDHEAELYISSHTVESQKPRWATNGLSASRAVGRTFLSMAWNYICTGRRDLRDHMYSRAQENLPRYATGANVTGPIRPIFVAPPDQRTLGTVDHWKPWEEAQAVVGLEACYRVTGAKAARDAAYMSAKTMMEHGWKINGSDVIIATAIMWKPNGQPLTAAELKDPAKVLWSYGTGFNEWSWSAIKLADQYARLYQDSALQAATNAVIPHVLGNRKKPREGGWDRFFDWDCVN